MLGFVVAFFFFLFFFCRTQLLLLTGLLPKIDALLGHAMATDWESGQSDGESA